MKSLPNLDRAVYHLGAFLPTVLRQEPVLVEPGKHSTHVAADASLSKHCEEWVQVYIPEIGACQRTLFRPAADSKGAAARGADPTYPGHLLGVTESYHPDHNGWQATLQKPTKHDVELA